MPKGLNIPLLPIPMLQAGIGLIKNTEIDVRFMPEIEMKGVSTDLFGIGTYGYCHGGHYREGSHRIPHGKD